MQQFISTVLKYHRYITCQVTYQGVDILSFVDQHPYLFWIATENRLDQWWLKK